MDRHLSAPQRLILKMQHRIAELEQMQREYGAFLNYVIVHHGEYDKVRREDVFVVHCDKLKMIKITPIRTEIVDGGARMIFQRVDNSDNNNKPVIVLPA